jgi:hypothetical protein
MQHLNGDIESPLMSTIADAGGMDPIKLDPFMRLDWQRRHHLVGDDDDTQVEEPQSLDPGEGEHALAVERINPQTKVSAESLFTDREGEEIVRARGDDDLISAESLFTDREGGEIVRAPGDDDLVA